MKNYGNLKIYEKSYFGLFYKIKVFDGDEKLFEKYCLNYYYDGVLIVADKSLITPDGRCSKILKRCKEGLYLTLGSHLEETDKGTKGRKHIFGH